MLKPQDRPLFGALVAVAITIAALPLSCPKQVISDTKATDVSGYNSELSAFWGWIVKDSISFFTFVLALATGGLVIYNGRQIRLSRDEFEATHRPRIVVQQIKSAKEGSFAKAKNAYVEIVMANAGETTATIHDWAARLYFRSEGSALMPFLNVIPITLSENGFDILPGDLKAVAASHREVEDEHAQFLADQAEMYVAGTILYSGPDRINRRMGFCRRWDSFRGTWQPMRVSEYEYSY